MRKSSVLKTQHRNTITYRIHKPGFALLQVQVKASETTGVIPQHVVIRQREHCWLVHYTPDVGVLSSLALVITDNTGQEIQFVDVPIIPG